MSNPELVTAPDLDQWSESLAAKSALPVLVRGLILATTSVSEITVRRTRDGEGVALTGRDGQRPATSTIPMSVAEPQVITFSLTAEGLSCCLADPAH